MQQRKKGLFFFLFVVGINLLFLLLGQKEWIVHMVWVFGIITSLALLYLIVTTLKNRSKGSS